MITPNGQNASGNANNHEKSTKNKQSSAIVNCWFFWWFLKKNLGNFTNSNFLITNNKTLRYAARPRTRQLSQGTKGSKLKRGEPLETLGGNNNT